MTPKINIGGEEFGYTSDAENRFTVLQFYRSLKCCDTQEGDTTTVGLHPQHERRRHDLLRNKKYGVPASVKMAEDHTKTNCNQKTASTQTARELTWGLHLQAWKTARDARRYKKDKTQARVVPPTHRQEEQQPVA